MVTSEIVGIMLGIIVAGGVAIYRMGGLADALEAVEKETVRLREHLRIGSVVSAPLRWFASRLAALIDDEMYQRGYADGWRDGSEEARP